MTVPTGMNVVDSCGWLEYFANGGNAGFFAPALETTESLIVPSLSVFEVCKRVALMRGEQPARQAADFMARRNRRPQCRHRAGCRAVFRQASTAHG